MNKNPEQNYEAQNVCKIEGAATPASEQATINMEDSHFQESVAVLYDSSNWIAQYLKPSGRKYNASFRAMKLKTVQAVFMVNDERRLARMIRVLHSIRDVLQH